MKSILDKEYKPLNDEEMEKLTRSYSQDFNKMNPKEAVNLLKLFLPLANNNSIDKPLFKLLVRRLNMIVNFNENPELLI